MIFNQRGKGGIFDVIIPWDDTSGVLECGTTSKRPYVLKPEVLEWLRSTCIRDPRGTDEGHAYHVYDLNFSNQEHDNDTGLYGVLILFEETSHATLFKLTWCQP